MYFPYFTLASDIRSSKIQNCCCFENANGLWFVYKTKLTLEIKRKHLKDNHLEISKIYSSFILVQTHYNLKNIAFVLVFRGLFACRLFAYFWFCFCHSNIKYISPPLANGAVRRSGSKPGARVLIRGYYSRVLFRPAIYTRGTILFPEAAILGKEREALG